MLYHGKTQLAKLVCIHIFVSPFILIQSNSSQDHKPDVNKNKDYKKNG